MPKKLGPMGTEMTLTSLNTANRVRTLERLRDRLAEQIDVIESSRDLAVLAWVDSVGVHFCRGLAESALAAQAVGSQLVQHTLDHVHGDVPAAVLGLPAHLDRDQLGAFGRSHRLSVPIAGELRDPGACGPSGRPDDQQTSFGSGPKLVWVKRLGQTRKSA